MGQLRANTYEKVIRGRRLVKELTGAGGRFLADYRLANYVRAAQINDITLDGLRCKAPASSFFSDKAELLVIIEGGEYRKPFNVVLFDTFIVIEIAPRTEETEFLVLVPNFETKTGSYILSDSLKSTSVLDTLDAIKASQGYAGLLDEAATVLASLDAVIEKSA